MHLPTSLFTRSLIMSAITVALNLILLVILKPLAGVPPTFMTLSFLPVVLWSILGTTGATVVFVLVKKYATAPEWTFMRIAIGTLIVSFIPDLLLLQVTSGPFGGATWSAVFVLMLMHIVAAVVSISILLNRPFMRLFGSSQ